MSELFPLSISFYHITKYIIWQYSLLRLQIREQLNSSERRVGLLSSEVVDVKNQCNAAESGRKQVRCFSYFYNIYNYSTNK